MGSMHFLITLAIVTVVAYTALATEYVVGDDKDWTIKFDYQVWAQGKEFHVGDKLTFNYPAGVHNVFRVNGTAFQQCIITHSNEALTTGNDVITLLTLGRKWYICGVSKHCVVGNQKLFINVLPESVSPTSSPSSSPSATSAARGIYSPRYYGLMAALFGILFLVMV